MRTYIMHKFQSAPVVIGVVFISFFVAALLVSADWQVPASTPPICVAGNPGCDPPLHTGTATQSKKGGLILGDFGGPGGLTVLNGNVGIGVAPTQKLDIRGNINLTAANYPIIYFNEEDMTDFTDRWRIIADAGTLTFRRKTQAGAWTGTSESQQLRLMNNGNVEIRDGYFILDRASDDVSANHIFSYKSRGTQAAPLTVASGDQAFLLRGYGYDGNSNEEVGRIAFDTEGVIADESVPGRMIFYTASAANPSVLTARMTIKSSGNVGIGTTNPSEALHVNGNITATKVFNAVYAP